MTPSDLVMVRDHISNCDHDSAARELARVLRLDADAERALLEIIEEAYTQGLFDDEERDRRSRRLG